MLYRKPEALNHMVKDCSVFTVQTAQVYIYDVLGLFYLIIFSLPSVLLNNLPKLGD